MRFIGWLAIGLSAIGLWAAGAGGARAQWGGLVDESDALMTSTFAFNGSNPEAGTSNENYYDGDFADFDGDGLADRLLGSRYGLLLNTGGGLMVPIRRQVGFLLRGDPGAAGWGEDAAQFADVDNDGVPDALMGGNGEPLSCQINSRWRFRTAWTQSHSALNIVNTDVEGDGDVDLVVSHAFCSMSSCGGPVRFALLINDGTGTFTEQSAARGIAFGNTDYIVGSVSGDLDGDGDFDLAIARGGTNQIIIAINDGTGNYTQRPTSLPTPGSGFGQAMNLGDIDDDGDLDIVLGRGAAYAGGHPVVGSVIGINDGAGNFTDESATRWVTSLTTTYVYGNAKLVDIDYDGDLDFVAMQKANMMDANHYFHVYLNDGTGVLTYAASHAMTLPGRGSGLGFDVDITDLDGDGSYDVWLGAGGDRVRILMNTYADSSGLPADAPRNVRVTSATGPGITVAWQAPPFAATARGYRVYRSTAPGLHDRDRELIAYVGFSPHQDEGFSAPITRHTTTADLGQPDVTLVPATEEVQYLDRTARPGVTYYYSVSHIGTENTEGRQAGQAMGTLPASGADTTGPDVAIVSPTRRAWSRYPRIVVLYGDESGIDLSTLSVSFDAPLGGGMRAAGNDISDIYYRRDSGAYVAYLEAPLSLPMDTLVTMTVSVDDMVGNNTTETVQFFVGVDAPMLPTASMTASPTSGMAPLTVGFDGSASSDPDGKIVRWEWYFGDGSTSIGRQVSHTFQYGATYDVTLVVRDGEGGVGSASQAITVSGPPPPDGGVCTPDCAGKVCGTDGCGGTCGSCGASETCMAGACVCVPDCSGRSCGGDGCGGSCGTCAGSRVCGGGGMCLCSGSETDCGGTCVDTRSDEANCGACGNACGAGESCVASTCQVGGPDGGCVADCSGRSCGDDGCGGICGTCGADQLCASGGQCLCMDSGTACGAECVDVRSDARHCGACDSPCGAGASCVAGRCEGGTGGGDAGTSMPPPGGDDVTGSCGCRAAGAAPGSGPSSWWSLVLLFVVGVWRRRARR